MFLQSWLPVDFLVSCFPCGMLSESWQSLHSRRGKWSQNKEENARSVVFPSTPDAAGNEYDLSALSSVRKPWTAVDTSVHGKKRSFYLSVCTPLPAVPGCHGALAFFLLLPWSLTGARVSLSSFTILVFSGMAVGSCMVSDDNSWNLGVVQISPQVTGNGSLSLLYVNGDRCGNQRFSTRIMFECAQTSVSVHSTGSAWWVVTSLPFSL